MQEGLQCFSECQARNECLALQANMKITACYLLLTLITFPPELSLRMATEKCKTCIRVVIILLQKVKTVTISRVL